MLGGEVQSGMWKARQGFAGSRLEVVCWFSGSVAEMRGLLTVAESSAGLSLTLQGWRNWLYCGVGCRRATCCVGLWADLDGCEVSVHAGASQFAACCVARRVVGLAG
jgi:hypothetical protein